MNVSPDLLTYVLRPFVSLPRFPPCRLLPACFASNSGLPVSAVRGTAQCDLDHLALNWLQTARSEHAWFGGITDTNSTHFIIEWKNNVASVLGRA